MQIGAYQKMSQEINVTCEYENRDFAERACRLIRDSIPGISSITIYTNRTADRAYGYEYPPFPGTAVTGKYTVGIIKNDRFGGVPYAADSYNDRELESEYKMGTYVSVRTLDNYKDAVTSLMTTTHGLGITLAET